MKIRLFLLLALFVPRAFGQSTFAEGTIAHIIYIIKENRSFDSYFGAYPGVQSFCQGGHSPANTVCIAPNDATNQCTAGDTCPQPACSSATASCTGTGIASYQEKPFPLLLESAATTYADISHTHLALVEHNHNGLMDDFDTKGCNSPTTSACGYVYFDRTQIPIYWSYADTYGLEDHFFSAETPSMPGHFYIFAGSSHGISDNASRTLLGGDSCLGGPNAGAECTTASQCPGSICGSGQTWNWHSAWTCEAKHTGTT